MTDGFRDEDVKTRLILAGITELEEHGTRDFSLRRSALLAGVSCAAPYRYFKSKEEYIAKIFAYLASKWELLVDEISSALSGEGKRLVTELSMAYIGFWLANRNLRSALLFPTDDGEGIKLSDFDSKLSLAIRSHFISSGYSSDAAEIKTNAVRAEIYGYITLIGAGELSNDAETLDTVRRELDARF